MFKIIPHGINRLDIEKSGKLNAEDMKIALYELASKWKNKKTLKMNRQYSLQFFLLGGIADYLSNYLNV